MQLKKKLRPLAFFLSCLINALIWTATAYSAPYEIVSLDLDPTSETDFTRVFDINSSGTVVGTTTIKNSGVEELFTYTVANRFTVIPSTVLGISNIYNVLINDSGQVAILPSQSENRILVYDLNTAALQEVAFPSEKFYGLGMAQFNSAGQITGFIETDQTTDFFYQPYLYTPSLGLSFHPLGIASNVTDLNDNGVLVGAFFEGPGTTWQGFKRDELGQVVTYSSENGAVTKAKAINNGGDILVTKGRKLMMISGGTEREIYNMEGYEKGTLASSDFRLNNSGDVIGDFGRPRKPIYAKAGSTAMKLSCLFPRDVATGFSDAVALNDSGQIVGNRGITPRPFFRYPQRGTAYLLQPTGEEFKSYCPGLTLRSKGCLHQVETESVQGQSLRVKTLVRKSCTLVATLTTPSGAPLANARIGAFGRYNRIYTTDSNGNAEIRLRNHFPNRRLSVANENYACLRLMHSSKDPEMRSKSTRVAVYKGPIGRIKKTICNPRHRLERFN